VIIVKVDFNGMVEANERLTGGS